MFGPDYSRSRRARGARLPVLVALVLLLAAVTPVLAQSDADPAAPTLQTLDAPLWAVALQPTPLRSQPGDDGEQFTTLRPNSPLQILGYAGDWAYVYNPRSKGTAYVRSDQLGPGDPPSAYAEKDPPPLDEAFRPHRARRPGHRRFVLPNRRPVSRVHGVERGGDRPRHRLGHRRRWAAVVPDRWR